MPRYQVTLRHWVSYTVEVETAHHGDAEEEAQRLFIARGPAAFPVDRVWEMQAIGVKQIAGTPTTTLHGVTLTELEEMPNGYVLARGADGLLDVHDRESFRGYVNPWGKDRWQVCWADHTRPSPIPGDRSGMFRHRRNFKSQRGAEQFLERKARAYPSMVQP